MERQELEQIIAQSQDEWLAIGLRFFDNDSDDARDALQETLLRLWLVRSRLESATDVRALGIRIMKNECVNIHRRHQHSSDEPLPDEPSMDDNPHRRLAAEEELSMLEWAIDNLPEQTRCLMQLRYYEGLSLDEIVAATGKKKSSVKVMISRAKQRLTIWIKKQE